MVDMVCKGTVAGFWRNMCIGGICGGCRDWDAVRARERDEDRGGTLPGGMLYILETLLLSVGLGGDGDLEGGWPPGMDRIALLSTLVFLSGSLFSP